MGIPDRYLWNSSEEQFMRRLTLALIALVALGAVPARAADDKAFFFKDGDVVVMIGDSITEQHFYSNYVEMWTVTRFPAWKLTFRNTGIGGDTSGGGNGRFKRDVLRYNPTAMTVDFGMNDGGYQPFNEPRFSNYVKGLQGMADQATAARIRVAWITPQPLDTDKPGNTEPEAYNKTLEKYGDDGIKEIAAKNEGLFVDQFHPYLAVLNKARGGMEPYKRITAGDAVHPGPPGQALMAASILKGMHFPSFVASVEISAVKEIAPQAKNCKISELSFKDGGVSFQQQDAALPFFPPEAASILKWAPILEELNDYQLKVTELSAGKYEVRLGGKKVAEYTADELAKGVNLASAALKDGPVAEQMKAVKDAVEKKNKHHHDRIFRGVVLASAAVPDWLDIKLTPQEIEEKRQSAFKDRMAKMPELDAEVRKALEMKPHTVEVVPVK
jgi:lysophospholipase L1-like esterase